MLAQRAPGRSSDVAPTWLISDATVHSAQEFKRSDRVAKLSRGRGRGRDGGDGGGRGDAAVVVEAAKEGRPPPSKYCCLEPCILITYQERGKRS